MSDATWTSRSAPLHPRRDAGIAYDDGSGRTVDLRVEEPDAAQVSEVLRTFADLCRGAARVENRGIIAVPREALTPGRPGYGYVRDLDDVCICCGARGHEAHSYEVPGR